MIRRLALGLTAVGLTYLALLRLAVTLDYWERRNRPADPHSTGPRSAP